MRTNFAPGGIRSEGRLSLLVRSGEPRRVSVLESIL